MDLKFNILDERNKHRGDFEISVGNRGEIISVSISGIKVKGMVSVNEFIELLLDPEYILSELERRDNDD